MQTAPEMQAQQWSSLAWMDQEELACASGVSQVFTACSSLLRGNLVSPCQGQPGRGSFWAASGRVTPTCTRPTQQQVVT